MVKTSSSLIDLAGEHVSTLIRESGTVLVDVREPFERQAEWIEGSVSVPLTGFDGAKLRADHPDKQIIFHCKGGSRSADAAARFQQATGEDTVYHLAGGIEAWKQQNQPVQRNASAPRIDVMRQVQMTAGGLVAIGTGLGVAISPWFLALPMFVGCGLFFAGASGWCGMAKLLAKMPWNRMGCGGSCGS